MQVSVVKVHSAPVVRPLSRLIMYASMDGLLILANAAAEHRTLSSVLRNIVWQCFIAECKCVVFN